MAGAGAVAHAMDAATFTAMAAPKPEPEPEPERSELDESSCTDERLGLQARLQARAWLARQGFDLLQIVAIERISSYGWQDFNVARLQEQGILSLRAELAAHWGAELRLSATWLEHDDADKPTAEELLLQAAETELSRLRTQLHHTRSSAASELSAAKADVARLENELWSMTRSADAFKARAEASAAAARAAAERQAEAVAEASRVAAMKAAQAADAERQRLRARLHKYAREAETMALRRAEKEAVAIREAATASAAAELLQIGPEQAMLAVEPAPEPPVINVCRPSDDEDLRLAKAEAEAERLRRELLASRLNSSYNLLSMQVSLNSHTLANAGLGTESAAGVEQVDLARVTSAQPQWDDISAAEEVAPRPLPPTQTAAASTSRVRQPQRRRQSMGTRECRTIGSSGRVRRQRPRSAMARIGSGASYDSTSTGNVAPAPAVNRANRSSATSKPIGEAQTKPPAVLTQEAEALNTLLGLSDYSGTNQPALGAARAAWSSRLPAATAMRYPPSVADNKAHERQAHGLRRRQEGTHGSLSSSGGLSMW